jgi:intracellular multiplication protein IcmK
MKTRKEKKQILEVNMKTVIACFASLSLLFCSIGYAADKESKDSKEAEGSSVVKLFQPKEEEKPTVPVLKLPVADEQDAAQKANIKRILATSSMSEQAFSKVAKELMPLTPDQIKTLHYLFNTTQRAVAASPDTPPKPITRTLNVDLSPGATPPVVRLSSGLVTSLIFLDATSAAWEIEWYDIGDPKRFSIKSAPKGGNTMMIQALTSYKSANMAVKLKGLSTPVMMTLIPGQKSVDYRVDLRVPGIGPQAVSVGSGLPTVGNPNLLGVLNGVAPDKSRTLNVSGGSARAWEVDGKLYIRTRMTILSPGWLARMTSGDGTNAYELPVSPVVLALDNGATVSLQIKEQQR